jgi:uncharacterized repeat protein (TIGR04138 family)
MLRRLSPPGCSDKHANPDHRHIPLRIFCDPRRTRNIAHLPSRAKPVSCPAMPPSPEPRQKTPQQLVDDLALYPPHAYDFLQEGLEFTVRRIHNAPSKPKESRHVDGRQLCEGLRELALEKWGRLARTVLHRWNITSTLDFGRIVFALIEVGQMQKTDADTLEDFKNVYDFKAAFESGYRIPSGS